MILLGSFFFGILVGLFIERHRLGVTSWGPKGGVCSSPSSYRSSRVGRRSRRLRSDKSAWNLRPSPSLVSFAPTSVPSSSIPCSSVPTSCPLSTTGSVCKSVSSKPRKLKRHGKMIGFSRPSSKVTWVDDSTTAESRPSRRRYVGLGRRRPRHCLPMQPSTNPPSTTATSQPPSAQPSTSVQTPIQITNLASNVAPVTVPVATGRRCRRGRRRTNAWLLFHRT